MKQFIHETTRATERCEELARHLINQRTTVRETAQWFGISKSTVHKDVTERLCHVNPGLFDEVKELFEVNKSERHLRGGEATRQKYKRIKADNSGKPSGPSEDPPSFQPLSE